MRVHPRLVRIRRRAVGARRDTVDLPAVPLSPQQLAEGGAHPVRHDHPAGADHAAGSLHRADRPVAETHPRRGAVVADGGAGERSFVDKHGVESRARGRGPLAARPRRDHIAAEAVQLQPEVAVRGHLKPQARKRIDGPRREPVPAGFVAAGGLRVEKQGAHAGPLRGDRGGGTRRACAHNDEVEQLTHAPHSASATRKCTRRGYWATVSALHMGPSNLQGRYL